MFIEDFAGRGRNIKDIIRGVILVFAFAIFYFYNAVFQIMLLVFDLRVRGSKVKRSE